MSSLDSDGSETSNPFEIDVDEALREFDAPFAASAAMPGKVAAGTVDSSGDTVAPSSSILTDKNAEPSDEGLPTDETLSSQSSDPDVIHIDLMQRPPPLPMSGLALEEIVSMLPGSTYAVSGSGIPMRTSPRSEPLQQSPSAKSSPGPQSAAMGAASAGSDQGIDPGQDADAKAGGKRNPTAQASCGQGAGSGPGSPQVALTFIPGLGLVPVVIHDVLKEDEEEDSDQDGSGFEISGAGEGAESEGDAAGGASGAAAADGDASGGADGVQAADGSHLPCTSVVTASGRAAGDEEVVVEDARTSPEGQPSGAADFGADAAARPGAVDGSSRRLDISEGQLKDIIQKAMHGIDFHDSASEGVEGDDGDDDPEGSLGSGEVGFDSPERHAVFERLFTAGGRPATAGGNGEKATTFNPSVRQLLGAFGRSESASRPGYPAQSCGPPVAAAAPSERRGVSQDSDEYEDDLVDEEGNESLDAVDDSGSGGGDEPESILGGLGHTRIGYAADGVLLGHAASTVAQMGQHTSTTIEASGSHALRGTSGSTARDTASASAAKGVDDAHFTVRVSDSGSAAGLHLPRPRYLTHNVVRSGDVFHGRPDDESPLVGPDGVVELEAAAGGLSNAICPESARAVAAPPTQALDNPASDAVASGDDSSSSRAAMPMTRGSSGASSSGSSAGGDLNSTLRMTGQSLAAIRQAALQAEGQRQAKSMAERLGGGGDHGPRLATNDRHQHHHPDGRAGKHGAAIIKNPFGSAEHEALAAAGLIDVVPGRGGGTSSVAGRHHAGRRGGSGGGTAGYEHMDGRHRHPSSDEEEVHEYTEEEGVEEDLEDLLRDRTIIQPRYPTDVKGHHKHHNERRDAEHSHHHTDALPGAGGSGDLSATMESDGSGGWRPRHRRSVDVVDLDRLANGEAGLGQTLRAGGGTRSRSLDGSSTASPPSSRSLLATRKSDDGLPPPPLASSSPRLRGEDSGSDSSSTRSSSAQSVADERLVDELEALREELGQKTTLVAGLRGELRKYTDLAMRLEHKLAELRVHAGDAGSAAAKARNRSQSETGALASAALAAATTAPGNGMGPDQQLAPQRDGLLLSSQQRDASQLPHEATPPGGPAPEGVYHALPPHPQAQGLDGAARLALYRDLLSQAQLQVGRSGGPAPPDMRDAQELFRNKETLDAGTEKVMLIKLQKIVAWGCEAAWKASVAQQQTKFMEHAAHQAAQARAAWEEEREQLMQALEEAHATGSPGLSVAAHGAARRASDGAGGLYLENELRRQLQAAQDEAAVARDQAADLESAVASLNADVRKLRVQLRSSRDGATEQPSGGLSFETGGATGAVSDSASRADSKAWALERKLLLTTITSLKDELEQARAASADSVAAAAAAVVDGLHDFASDEAVKKLALADATLERVEQLQMERDAALEESARLRQQMGGTLASAAAEGVDLDPGAVLGAAGSSRAERGRWELEELQLALATARDVLDMRTADMEAAAVLHEQQSAVLRAQVVELRQELAAAGLAAAVGRRDEDQRALEAEQEAVALKDELIQELQERLLTCEVERDELKTAFAEEVGEKHGLEEKLRQAREALASALHAAERAHEAMEQQAASAVDPLAFGRASTMASLDNEEALRVKNGECERLQRLAEARARELALAETQLDDVRTAVAELQAEASDTQTQVAELQAILRGLQHEREAADVELTTAKADASAAEERSCDAHTASLLAEAALTRALEEAEALRRRVSGLEQELEDAGLWRGRAEEAQAALAEARVEVAELRACAAGLQAEARDLRTALSAEDSLQSQLRGQVECLESELEAQASLAQSRGDQAARMEAALVEAEHKHRHDTSSKATGRAAEAAATGELREAQAAAAEAQQRALELEMRVTELQAQLDEAVRRCEEAAPDGFGTEIELQHVEVMAQRASTEPQVLNSMVGQLGSLEHAPDGLQRWQHAAAGEAALVDGAGAGPSYAAAGDVAAAGLEGRLRAAEREREALREEASALRRQLEDNAGRSAAATPPRVHEAGPQPDDNRAAAAEREAVLHAEQVRLLAECVALQAELEQARTGAAARRDAEAQVEVLRHQVQAARSELQAASVELSVKGELMAAKDRSLATLQETVDALKLALQVTQQNIQPMVPSPRRSVVEAEVLDGNEQEDRDLQRYRGSVVALQSKFADSEFTIRRLEKQVAALETRLSTDDSLSPTLSQALPSERRRSQFQSQLQPPQLHPTETAALELQLRGVDAENARLLQELASSRGPTAAAAADLGHAVGSPPHGLAGGSSADAASAASTINSLQMQLLQWQNVSEDLHTRYQSKKDTARRLREQLAAEQKRRADEQAHGQAQLEAASQRLGRLAADLGTTLRRCIALDLQPLSATMLTTSPRAALGGGVLPDDINALASLLARQGAALIEALEMALDHVSTAREERSLVTAQLANRQAVLDELRHHLARQAVSAPGRGEGAAAAAAHGTAAGPRMSQASPAMAADVRQAAPAFAASAGGAATPAGGSHPPGSAFAAAAAAAADTSPRAAPAGSPSSSTSVLHAATINLAQDMAALSAQQAGLRSTLHGLEQRNAQQQANSRPRSLSAAAAAYSPAAAAGSSYPLHSLVSYPAVSPLSTHNIGAAADSFSAATAAIPSGSPPHAYVGILSGSRLEPRNPLGGAASTGGGLHGGFRHAYGVYGQPGYSTMAVGGSSPEGGRVFDLGGRDALGAVALRSPTRLQFLGSPGGGSAGGALTAAGGLGLSASAGTTGLGSGLGLSRDRRLKLAETGL